MKDYDWERLEPLGNIPVDAALLKTIFSDYASSSNKIEELCRRERLLRVKRGLYIVAPKISRKTIDKMLVANHLYGPSYVSFETALESHGMIPEAVYEIRSATTNRAKQYDSALGRYSYFRVPEEYFGVGIQIAGTEEGRYLIASPEKALCDFLMLSSNLRIQSSRAMKDFLENFMRVDMGVVAGFDEDIVRACIETGRKKMTLARLLEVMRNG